MLDVKSFDPTAVAPETAAFNAGLVAKLSLLPDPWAFPASMVRQSRRLGLGPLPLLTRSPRARTMDIPGPGGPIPLRIIAPDSPKGVYMHFHSGGWTYGAADEQDPWLERLADCCGLACVSVDYRLAPEDPYPAGPDDAEAAALWLIREGPSLFGTKRFVIGGESAGAHLAVVTLLRLRDRHAQTPFCAANLNAGSYDLSLTPSAAHWGSEKLVLNTRDLKHFVLNFVGKETDPRHPDISPLYADLKNLPPALFTVGTRDPLLDDSLFMASRWVASGNKGELAIWPGGCHVFIRFPLKLTEAALARIEDFLTAV